ncbi:Glutamate formimidoyltransferase [bioreactor metagenome]|uniref:glutamate formimidoyltransferase n=1 Tax=bioreactor metagenome TaxID=1076179 RepID=A0A644ZTY0_9ZZZZ
MAQIIECVPNISSADPALVAEAAAVVRSTPGVTLLDTSSDQSHNRSVITFVGDAAGAEEAAVKLAKFAAEHIDLTKHKGEHPRMGAVDVVPFIPIRDVTMSECVALSKRAAERIWKEAGIPVFLYEASASAPNRENLASIRKGQFEGMAEKVRQPEWEPDFGGCTVHPTAGVVAVGARAPLIAFNINLSTSDVAIADKIARVVRFSGGGLSCVKAIGVLLKERNVAQVSINMTNYCSTPLYRVLEFVRFEAARYGVSVIGTEVVGLLPMRALIDSAEYYLGIENFEAEKQVLEYRL